MSSLVLTIKSDKSLNQLADMLTKSGEARDQALILADLFKRAACGLELINFDVQLGANQVRASNTVTLTYASIANNDTVTVAGTALTCVTGTPTGAQFKKVTDGATTAENLAALINANTTLAKVVSATSSGAVVTVKAVEAGEAGNFITLATSNATGFGLGGSVLASGAGAADQPATTYSLGL
jgi:phage tail sheath gpL-like